MFQGTLKVVLLLLKTYPEKMKSLTHLSIYGSDSYNIKDIEAT